jgi:hypothetical protein
LEKAPDDNASRSLGTMVRLMMVLAIIAVGFVSMKSCDTAVSLQNQQTLQYKQEIDQKLRESDDMVRERLRESDEIYRQQLDQANQ